MLGIGLYVFLGIIALLFIIVIVLAIVTVTRAKARGRAPLGGDDPTGDIGENYRQEQELAARHRGYNDEDNEAGRHVG